MIKDGAGANSAKHDNDNRKNRHSSENVLHGVSVPVSSGWSESLLPYATDDIPDLDVER